MLFDMITFKISFILSFPIKPKPDVKKTQQGNEKGKLGNESKKIKNKNQVKEEEEIISENPKYIFEADKILGVAHIEYELVPNRLKYQIDVKCWESVAKIFTSDGQISLKVLEKNDAVWVPICLEQYLERISVNEIKELHDHIIKFEISNNVAKLGKIAASDKSLKFYAYAHEADLDFIEIYETDPNVEDESIERQSQSREKLSKHTFMSSMSRHTYVSQFTFADNFDMICDIINKHCAGVEIECKDFVMPCSPPVELPKKVKLNLKQEDKKEPRADHEKDNGKDKTKKGEQGTKSDSMTISVPAEIFFTDPHWAIYKKETNNGVLSTVYISFSVECLLSRAQKLLLDPFVIKIKTLNNLPVDILKKMGITSVYTSYSIPCVANCKGIEKPVAKKIKFNEGHIFFGDGTSKLKLVEFLQTKKLYVEIYGTKVPEPHDIRPLLFGHHIDDNDISKIRPAKKSDDANVDNTSVLLAVCTYNISSVVENIWDFKEKGQCHAPNLTLYKMCKGFYEEASYTDMRNVNEININLNYLKKYSPIPEAVLLSSGTTLKVEVYLMAPQTASLILLRIPNTFKRFLFILHSLELARDILIGIINHNDRLLSSEATASEKNNEYRDIITGFLIDNGNCITIFVEGLSTGFILSIENITITNYDRIRGKFFFNTDTVFERRLYKSFIQEGLNIMTLRIPLSSILSEQRIYWDGNIPGICLEALKKLSLLYNSSSFQSILQYNLLPTPEELLSLNLEWGVPLMVKKEED